MQTLKIHIFLQIPGFETFSQKQSVAGKTDLLLQSPTAAQQITLIPKHPGLPPSNPLSRPCKTLLHGARSSSEPCLFLTS